MPNPHTAQRAALLAAEPMRPAGPRKGVRGGVVSALRDLAAHRELLGMLVRREIKARYKDSALGMVWSLGRPLAMLGIYYVVLGQFLGAARGIDDFAIFVYTGLTAWGLFSDAVSAGTGSIIANGGLVKKVYVPREMFPLASVGSALFNFGIQMVVLIVATAALGHFPTGARWLYFPLALVVILVYATALALFLSAANVYLRDISYLIEIAIMLFFWVSPIVYHWTFMATNLPAGWSAGMRSAVMDIYLANPITLAILGFQRAFWVAGDTHEQIADLAGRLGIVFAVGVALLWLAQRYFTRKQADFAQEL